MRRLSSILDRNKFLAQSGSISAFASRSEVLVELANVYKVVTFSTNFQPLPGKLLHFHLVPSPVAEIHVKSQLFVTHLIHTCRC